MSKSVYLLNYKYSIEFVESTFLLNLEINESYCV